MSKQPLGLAKAFASMLISVKLKKTKERNTKLIVLRSLYYEKLCIALC